MIVNSSATAMLGLAGMAVLAVSDSDGEVEYAIETTAAAGWCPVCGAQARLHNRRPTWVRDLPAGDRAVTLVWSSAVARDFGVGWAAVMAAVIEYGSPLIEHPDRIEGVAAVGVDETAFARANPIRSTVFATGIVDLHRGKLIDIIPGRSRKVLADWLIDQPAEWTAGIEVAALDPFRGYGAALSAGLPNAMRVLDAFHVVRLGFAAVDDVRRRVQQQTCGHRGRRTDPLYGIRRVLRRGAENLSTHAWARLLAGIEAGDEHAQVAAAWVAAQERHRRARLPVADRDHARREPQIALRDIARVIGRAAGRIRRQIRRPRTRSLKTVIPRFQPTRSAITVAGIVGTAVSWARMASSNASTADPAGLHSYFGGPSEANAARTVLREIPNVLAINLIGNPSARCKRRISAQSSTDNNSLFLSARKPRLRRRGSKFTRRHGFSFQASPTQRPISR